MIKYQFFPMLSYAVWIDPQHYGCCNEKKWCTTEGLLLSTVSVMSEVKDHWIIFTMPIKQKRLLMMNILQYCDTEVG